MGRTHRSARLHIRVCLNMRRTKNKIIRKSIRSDCQSAVRTVNTYIDSRCSVGSSASFALCEIRSSSTGGGWCHSTNHYINRFFVSIRWSRFQEVHDISIFCAWSAWTRAETGTHWHTPDTFRSESIVAFAKLQIDLNSNFNPFSHSLSLSLSLSLMPFMVSNRINQFVNLQIHALTDIWIGRFHWQNSRNIQIDWKRAELNKIKKSNCSLRPIYCRY